MIHIQEAIVVEGTFDKRHLLEFLDATIVETGGFSIFRDTAKISLLRELARRRGIVILTDSDRAGMKIRGHLKGMLGGENVKHAYVPEVSGKERRKRQASKDGMLGVEGMREEDVLRALREAGCVLDGAAASSAGGTVTRADLYAWGLYGGAESAEKRARLAERLHLPSRVTVGTLLEVVNALYKRDEFEKLFLEIEKRC